MHARTFLRGATHTQYIHSTNTHIFMHSIANDYFMFNRANALTHTCGHICKDYNHMLTHRTHTCTHAHTRINDTGTLFTEAHTCMSAAHAISFSISNTHTHTHTHTHTNTHTHTHSQRRGSQRTLLSLAETAYLVHNSTLCLARFVTPV